jgi:hypothetical protein
MLDPVWRRRIGACVLRAVRWTGPIESSDWGGLDVVTLLDRVNVDAYLVAIKSFFCYYGRPARVTVLSDGSITPGQKRLLQRHVRGLRLIETRGGVPNLPGRSSRLQKIYDENVRTRKLLALPVHDLKRTVLILDSDVVFRAPLGQEFVLPEDVALRYLRDRDHRESDPLFHLADAFMDGLPVRKVVHNLNSGLVLLRKSALNLDLVADFLLYLDGQDKLHPLMEQDGYALLASMVESEPFSDRFWVSCNPEHWNSPDAGRCAAAKHYGSSVRWSNADYVADCWRAMREFQRTRPNPAASPKEPIREDPRP